MKPTKRPNVITVGLSGASGMPYGLRLVECLLAAGETVALLISNAALAVLKLEMQFDVPSELALLKQFFYKYFNASTEQLFFYGEREWTAPIASGSAVSKAMVICPCSSGCVAAIAHGASNNLLERAADVVLKERQPLILVHRETPLSVIHLENLTKLAKIGATILPASPGFYHKPTTINELVDFVVARILDNLAIEHDLVPRWGV